MSVMAAAAGAAAVLSYRMLSKEDPSIESSISSSGINTNSSPSGQPSPKASSQATASRLSQLLLDRAACKERISMIFASTNIVNQVYAERRNDLEDMELQLLQDLKDSLDDANRNLAEIESKLFAEIKHVVSEFANANNFNQSQKSQMDELMLLMTYMNDISPTSSVENMLLTSDNTSPSMYLSDSSSTHSASSSHKQWSPTSSSSSSSSSQSPSLANELLDSSTDPITLSIGAEGNLSDVSSNIALTESIAQIVGTVLKNEYKNSSEQHNNNDFKLLAQFENELQNKIDRLKQVESALSNAVRKNRNSV
jgi:hypothetical protein